MTYRMLRKPIRSLAVLALGLSTALVTTGCPRNQTTLDDRPMESRTHVETTRPVDKEDPFRP